MVSNNKLNIDDISSKKSNSVERWDYTDTILNEKDLFINKELNDIINEVISINNDLIYAEKKFESYHINLNKKIRNISNTKPYRIAYFIHRFKFEFLKRKYK